MFSLYNVYLHCDISIAVVYPNVELPVPSLWVQYLENSLLVLYPSLPFVFEFIRVPPEAAYC
jgi:hypothetical protein